MVQANAFWQLINFLTSGTWFKIIPFPLHSTAAGGPLSGHVAPTNESHVATQATFAHAQRPAWSGCCWRVQQLQLNQSSAALLFSLAPPTSSAALRLIPNPTDENLSPPRARSSHLVPGAAAFELIHADKQKPWSRALRKPEIPPFPDYPHWLCGDLSSY